MELKLNEYLVVGPSIVTDQYGLTNSMVAELFESVSLFLCSAWLQPPESARDTSALLTCIPAAEVPFTAKRSRDAQDRCCSDTSCPCMEALIDVQGMRAGAWGHLH